MNSRSIARRLAKLEKRLGINTSKPVKTLYEMNLMLSTERCECHVAQAAGHNWQRRPDESMQEFEKRVITDLNRKYHGMANYVLFYPADSPTLRW